MVSGGDDLDDTSLLEEPARQIIGEGGISSLQA
jgi:hypothetical protein